MLELGTYSRFRRVSILLSSGNAARGIDLIPPDGQTDIGPIIIANPDENIIHESRNRQQIKQEASEARGSLK